MSDAPTLDLEPFESGCVRLVLDMPMTRPNEWKVEKWPEGWEWVKSDDLESDVPVMLLAKQGQMVWAPADGDGTETPGDYLSEREAMLHSLARDVYSERLVFGVTREQAAKGFVACFAGYEKEQARLTADAQRWAMIRDTVIRLDAESRPGLPMGDDDIEGLVLQLLEHAARKSGRTHSSSALPGAINAS
jgi:hypothetical protein